ncbi:hypothetical protein GH714_031144 [Hevea brasiliensis]|uniref:Reverse transcriptase zinc-binding domain-containing protein n=1 Tax=Hevea brasiliensis TaxID=3981 RepID=A0A6A6LPI3_HEVBR|nr:hypothetical protein GH714_031144 [Hevea brasiliensis]
MNFDFLSKVGWRLLTGANGLWVDILRCKYFGNKIGLDALVDHSDASIIWRGIVNCKPILLQGICKSLCNCMLTLFLDDVWLGKKPLINRAINNVLDELRNSMGSQFWNGHDWKWDVLRPLLDDVACLQLESFASDPSCSRCGNVNEDLLHVLHDCPEARLVWSKVWDYSSLQLFNNLAVDEWLLRVNLIRMPLPGLIVLILVITRVSRIFSHVAWTSPREGWLNSIRMAQAEGIRDELEVVVLYGMRLEFVRVASLLIWACVIQCKQSSIV